MAIKKTFPIPGTKFRHKLFINERGNCFIEVKTPTHGVYRVLIDADFYQRIAVHLWYPIVQNIDGRKSIKIVTSFYCGNRQWRNVSLSRYVWELKHGPLNPPSRRVFTIDRDTTNMKASNLRLSYTAPALHLGRRFP